MVQVQYIQYQYILYKVPYGEQYQVLLFIYLYWYLLSSMELFYIIFTLWRF